MKSMIDRPASKYQMKNYEVVEFNLWETSCWYCEKPFAVDYSYLESLEIDGDYDWVKMYCPYCGRGQREHL